MREIHRTYSDPLDLIWLSTASRLGIEVVRSDEVFASWDGASVLTLSDDADLDPDDCLAQMIFHELCHALVEGPTAMKQADWGLCNFDERDMTREHACNRLQAALAQRYGLRELLAVTTQWRSYYDALPEDPLSGDDDPAIQLARAGWVRATEGPWAEALAQALNATAQLAQAVHPFTKPGSLWQAAPSPSPSTASPAGHQAQATPHSTSGGSTATSPHAPDTLAR